MRDYYEELWEHLPADLELPDLASRTAFLHANVTPGDRVLDLGCGEGHFTAELARLGAKPVGLEVADTAVARARRRHPDLWFERTRIDGPLPLADNAFDAVWASEVIEHVADTARWLSEVRRVLTPVGRLLITTPNHSRLRLLVAGIELYDQPLGDHLHLYSKASLRGVLRDFDFDEIEIHGRGGPVLARRTLMARAVR